MRKKFSDFSRCLKTCKLGVFASALILAASATAAPTTYNFSLGGFSNGGEVLGSFTGEDLNNDGYLSSFLFSNTNNADFAGSDFEAGLNEVTNATITFTGSFDGQEFGGESGQVTSFTLNHDLTDITDTMFGLPMDLFFVLNYNLQDGGTLGDEFFEGILLAPFNGSGVFGLGSMLPAPPDNFLFFDEVPAGDDVFEIINGLPNGSTLTSGILRNQSNGAPCVAGGACGVVHTVFPSDSFIPNIGGFDITNELAQVSRVSSPSTALMLSFVIAFAAARRLKKG